MHEKTLSTFPSLHSLDFSNFEPRHDASLSFAILSYTTYGVGRIVRVTVHSNLVPDGTGYKIRENKWDGNDNYEWDEITAKEFGRIDRYVELEIDKEAVACKCDKCDDEHVVEKATYKIPKRGHRANT